MTAKKLSIDAATVSMCVQLERHLDIHPQLALMGTLRQGYDLLQRMKRGAKQHESEVSRR